MGSSTDLFPGPALRREGHFDVKSRTPSGISRDMLVAVQLLSDWLVPLKIHTNELILHTNEPQGPRQGYTYTVGYTERPRDQLHQLHRLLLHRSRSYTKSSATRNTYTVGYTSYTVRTNNSAAPTTSTTHAGYTNISVGPKRSCRYTRVR